MRPTSLKLKNSLRLEYVLPIIAFVVFLSIGASFMRTPTHPTSNIPYPLPAPEEGHDLIIADSETALDREYLVQWRVANEYFGDTAPEDDTICSSTLNILRTSANKDLDPFDDDRIAPAEIAVPTATQGFSKPNWHAVDFSKVNSYVYKQPKLLLTDRDPKSEPIELAYFDIDNHGDVDPVLRFRDGEIWLYRIADRLAPALSEQFKIERVFSPRGNGSLLINGRTYLTQWDGGGGYGLLLIEPKQTPLGFYPHGVCYFAPEKARRLE